MITVLILSISSISLSIYGTTITNVKEPIILDDIQEPVVKTSAITNIEFIQDGGHSFTYNPSDPSNNYFSTGEGPFTLRLHLDSLIGSNQIEVELKGEDPTYHSLLFLDTAMMDEINVDFSEDIIAATLYALLDFADDITVALVSESTNTISAIIDSDNYNPTASSQAGHPVYDWTPSSYQRYTYETGIQLRGIDLKEIVLQSSFLTWLLGGEQSVRDLFESLYAGLLGVVYPREYVQAIKYDVTNKFTIKVNDNPVYEDVNIINADKTAPTYSEVTNFQENVGDDWEIKVKIQDEYLGSGVSNKTVYIDYSVNGGSWTRIDSPMLYEGGYFYGTLPNQIAGSEIKYTISYSDMAGNSVTTEVFTFYANPIEVQPILVLLIGIAIATIATIAATRIYRNRHQPRVITLPTKKKVDKYYKKVNKEGGSV